MQEQERHPLVKEVPGHLLQFEETIWGMTLTQLLTDIGGLCGVLAATGSLPLASRIMVCLLLMGTLATLVHGKIEGYTLLFWLFLLARARFLPTWTVWRPAALAAAKGEPPSVQECWIQLETLDHGIAASFVQRRQRPEPDVTCWAVLDIESVQNVRYLEEAEQIRIYGRFKTFLDGLSFPLKLLSLIEPAEPEHDPALQLQRQAVLQLKDRPHLQVLQQASLSGQLASLPHCTTQRHLVIVSVSSGELARAHTDDAPRSALARIANLIWPRALPAVPVEQVKRELQVRLSVLRKAFQQLDVRATLLEDASLLQAIASCLAPGAHLPSFEVDVLEQEMPDEEQQQPGHADAPAVGHGWQKRVRGLHGTFVYHSSQQRARLEEGKVSLADLLAPSAVQLGPDAVAVTVRGETRYQRYYEVTGFAPELICGWLTELTGLALPMLIATRCHPIENHLMIKRLEMHLTKLESQKVADQKAKRLTKAAHRIEAEQVRAVIDALTRKKLKIFAVSMVIGIHASSPERLEERATYLRSHLRDLQVRARPMTRRHDLGWRLCQPSDHVALDQFINLPSDALSTFMAWSTGVVGTPTGAYLGTTGMGLTKRPVYFHPWDERKRLPNPHVVICGESGMGKSWLAKTLIMGLLSANIADAVVLDRDGDYDAIHEYLGHESQRFNLAGICPLNIMDIPYGPADVRLEENIDLLAEFIDQHLLVGLALLYGEPLAKAQEAFLTHAARETYAEKGITTEAIRTDPQTLLREPPVFADLLATMKRVPASSEPLRLALLERFEQVSYLFPGQTTVQLACPLTIFNIHTLDEKWYPLMIYVVQTFLQRHRALRRDERYLAYVVEEASYMLKHPAGKRYLESGSRGFRKLGIAQVTLSQHPADFLEEGQVIISNAGTCFFLGMQHHAAQKLLLAEELERVLEEGVAGRAVFRCGREYAIIDVARQSPLHRALFTTDPRERRLLSRQRRRPAGTEQEHWMTTRKPKEG